MHSSFEVSWLTKGDTGTTGTTSSSSAANTKISLLIDIPTIIPTPGSVKKALGTIRTLQKAITKLIISLDALVLEADAHRGEMEAFNLPHTRHPACSACRASYFRPGPSRLMCRNSPGHDPSHVVDHHRLFLDNMRAELLWLGQQRAGIGGGLLWWVTLLGERLGRRSRSWGAKKGGKLGATIAYWACLEAVVRDYDWVWGYCWKEEAEVDCWEVLERACRAAGRDEGGLDGVNCRMRDYSVAHGDRAVLDGPVIYRWPKTRWTAGDPPVVLQSKKWREAVEVDPRLRRLPSEIPNVDVGEEEDGKKSLLMGNVLAITDKFLPESVKRKRRRRLKGKGKMPAL